MAGVSAKRDMKSEIVIGGEILLAEVCAICPREPKFYPHEAFTAHMLRHGEGGFDHDNWHTRQKSRAKKAQAARRNTRKTVH